MSFAYQEQLPPNFSEIEGNILDCTGIIVQQCNCLSRKPHGLSATIAERFPYANPYENRIGKRNLTILPSKPGTVEIYKISKLNTPIIACFMAQWDMGRPGSYNRVKCPCGDDTSTNREKWFKECLYKLGELEDIQEDPTIPISFPMGIGCGLAGGFWHTYRSMIIDYAKWHQQAEITIVKLV